VNPSGKLPYTIAAQATDYAASVLYSSSATHPSINYTEGMFVDYRWFDANAITPTFEFGFGLSYTTFAYSNLVVQQNISTADPFAVSVSATITNNGTVKGQEVVQLYLGSPDCAEPPKILRGFEKVWINPGSSVVVTFNLTSELLSVWNVSLQAWVVPAGVFQIYVGTSSRILPLQASFNISGGDSVLMNDSACHSAPAVVPPTPVSGTTTDSSSSAPTTTAAATTASTQQGTTAGGSTLNPTGTTTTTGPDLVISKGIEITPSLFVLFILVVALWG